MPKQKADQVAIVTGGARGIGAAIGLELARAGYAVVIADTATDGENKAQEIRTEGLTASFIRTDVSRVVDVQAMVDFTIQEFGKLDVLVNNSGIFPRANLLETTEELWNRVLDVNLKGVFLCCQAAVPLMKEGGSIVNIGSVNAYAGASNLFAYSISKGGVHTLTRNLARALAPQQIRVNCVNPGWVVTEGEIEVQRKVGAPEDWVTSSGRSQPLGRLQTPEDIAPAVVFLASDKAGQITGQIFSIDGGIGY